MKSQLMKSCEAGKAPVLSTDQLKRSGEALKSARALASNTLKPVWPLTIAKKSFS